MAKNVVINGVTYSAVPSVSIPLSGGGGNAVFVDTSDADATVAQIAQGATAYVNGTKLVGTMTAAAVSQDGTTKVLTIS